MVRDAVVAGLVSPTNFTVSRELAGKIHEFPAFEVNSAIRRALKILHILMEFPSLDSREFCLPEQGNLLEKADKRKERCKETGEQAGKFLSPEAS